LVAAKGKRRSYVYYRCTGSDAYRFAGQRVCSNRQLRSDLLEQAVWQDVCSLLSDPGRIEEEYQRRLNRKVDEGWDASTELRSAIEKLRRGISRLIDSYQGGLLEKEEFEPRVRAAKEKLERLQRELRERMEEQQQNAALQLVIGRMKEFAKEVSAGLAKADWATRRAIIRAMVKGIEVDEQEVRVVYKVAPDRPGPGPFGRSLQHCWRGDLAAVVQHLPACPGRDVAQAVRPPGAAGALRGRLRGDVPNEVGLRGSGAQGARHPGLAEAGVAPGKDPEGEPELGQARV